MGMMGTEVKGAWRINTFLFLLTGSYAVLLPWSPVILKAAGLSAAATGLTMAVIMLAGSLGVCSCLLVIKRTNSGAVRRLLLLLLSVTTSIIHITAVLLLPASAGGNTCLLTSLNTGTQQNSVLQVSVEEEDVSTEKATVDAVVSLNTFAQMHGRNTTASIVSKLETTTKISHNALTTYLYDTSKQIQETTKGIQDKTKLKFEGDSITTEENKISLLPIIENASKSQPANDETKLNTVKVLVMTETTESQKIYERKTSLPPTQPVEQTTNVNKSKKEQVTSQSSFQSNNMSQDTHSSAELAVSSAPSIKDKSTVKDHESIQADNTIANTEDFYETNNLPEGNTYDYYDEYYGYPDITDSEPPKAESSQAKSPDKLRPSHPSPPPPPPPPPKRKHHKSGRSWISKKFLTRNRDPSKSFNSHLEEEIKNFNNASHSDNKDAKNIPAHAPSTYYEFDKPVEKDAKSNYGYRRPVSGSMHRWPEEYQDHYDERRKRSVQPHGQAQKLSQESEYREDASTFPSYHDNEMNIRGIMDNINSPIGIKIGVAILLILGSTLGTGIEVVVAKLWHCYAHGYDEGGVNQDILQRTITHTFQLSIYANHKIWSGLTSGAWVVGGGVITSLVCIMGVNAGIYGMLGGMHLALGLCTVFMLLVIPVPYGSVEPPKTRRPLSLYLDDEVLKEGIRRLSFHTWVLVNGFVTALPNTFGLWIILEMTKSQGSAMAAQAGAVAVTLASESLTLHAQRWLLARIGLQGIMGVGGLAMILHLGSMWSSLNVVMVVISHSGLGCTIALLWVSVRHNALLLATVNDQEREAWVSWWCWRFGLCIGAAVWGSLADIRYSLAYLFKPASFIAISVSMVVATAAVMTRRQGRTRRRVYHTLDLDMADEDEEDEDDATEDDWLVRRAQKEGLSLD
ncbi:hypothetical protein SK128_021026 [Halocaridina rubra]|uniref:Major facilitator superfamily associated domain-containing protein n=1 Tax=Halocaridina rubra TaxID=373956 RepID=A0AAN8WRS4_HALRR